MSLISAGGAVTGAGPTGNALQNTALVTGVSAGGTYTHSAETFEIDTLGNASNFGYVAYTSPTNIAATDSTSNAANGRVVLFINDNDTSSNTIHYFTLNSPSNSSDFGDLANTRPWTSHDGACSNATNNRGMFVGASGSSCGVAYAYMDYVTISSTGNASNFGDLTQARAGPSATSNGTNNRGVAIGGRNPCNSNYNTIDYWNISSTGNATTFGTWGDVTFGLGVSSNDTNERAVGGGSNQGGSNTAMYYITINSTGNGTSFGSLSTAIGSAWACSNGTSERMCIGDEAIQYCTINSPSNTSAFGDLSASSFCESGTSGAGGN
jgi:hypothetical protein